MLNQIPLSALRRALLLLMVCPLAIFTACSGGQADAVSVTPSSPPETSAAIAAPAAPDQEEPEEPKDAQPVRSNEPHVRLPQATGEKTLGGDPLLIDISNASQGYIMARYTGQSEKANVQLIGENGVSYKYFFPPSEDYVTIPLSSGSGHYDVEGYENISGTKYLVLFKEAFDAQLEDERLPFLYPNQHVNFTADSQAVATAAEVVEGVSSDLDAVAAIYHYVVENITYDDEKARTVTTGYLPNVDETLATGTGICFDYAALTCAMLRSQNIPARLEIGYSGEIYHAWISVYLEETGWIDQLIEFSGDEWTRMDPTFAAGNDNSDSILEYIGDGSHYTVQYSR